jgi:Mn2+/Fe2+ NRAMP family transporter
VSVLTVLLLAVANVATIAADVAGVAAVLGMVTGIRWEFFVPLILLVLTLILRSGYGRVKQVLIALTLVLLSYVAAVLIARPDWGGVIRSTLLPQISLSSPWLVAALGLLGTTISPYMLF